MDLLLGPGFRLLYDVVKEAMGGEFLSYKPLNDLNLTLDSLESQTVQQIGDLNKKLGLSLSEVEGIQRQMGKATELVPKLSSKLQTYNCILKCQYSNQLVMLDRSLKALLGKLTIQGIKVQRETLFELRQMASNVAAEQATIEQKLTVQLDLGKKHGETLAGMEDYLRILGEKMDSFRNLVKKMGGEEEGAAEISPNAKQDAQEPLKLQGSIRRQLNTQQVDQEASQVMDHTLVPISNIVDLEVQQEPTEVAETLLPTSNITDQVVQQEPTEIAETLPTSNITDQEVQQESTEIAETLPTSNITDQEVQQESTEVAETLLPTSNITDLLPGAAVGVLFTVLYDVVKDLNYKSVMFRELIGDLGSTLEALFPLIEEIERYNGVLGRSNKNVEKIMRQIADGRELILKCSKLSWWNSFKKYKYAKQLLDLDNSLNRWLTILTVEGVRNGLDISREKLAVSKEALAAVQKNGLVGNKENVLIQKQERFHDMGSLPERPRVTVGLDGPLRDLKMMLFEDDVSMLVLTAAGGCGKTTVAMKICQDEDVKDKFKNNIFFVTVSKEPNLDVLQELYQRMNSQEGHDPLLLVLDDVWLKSKSLLQQFDEIKLPNYKILVTSRSEFPGFGTPYNLKALNDEDSMTLLRHSASLGNSLSVPEDLLKKILKHCQGVPLAITVTGKSLRGQATEFWLSRLREWSENSILDTETELLLGLQSSVDDLEEVVIKECFMDLGSFPEDQRIPAAALIDMWTELYKLDDDFLCIKNLLELTNRGLANLVIPRKENIETLDGYYVEYFVSQPALLRQLAIYNAKLDPIEDRKRLIVVTGHNQPKWLTEQKSQPINARLLSISSDGMFSEEWLSVHVPQVEVLVLNFKTENNALPEFVEKIDKLKVLIVTNYGSLPTGLSNFDLLGSLSNLKRIRLERISIPSITKNFVPLKSLKKISLFMCNVGQAFCNCNIKISDAWPSLEEMNIDYCHDLVSLPAELCDFVYLKKLSITNCHKLFALPDEIEKLENLEVLRLRSCTDLVTLPGSIEKLNKLYFLDIYNCINIKELPEHISEMSGLTKINMGQCSRLEDLPLSVWDLDQQRK